MIINGSNGVVSLVKFVFRGGGRRRQSCVMSSRCGHEPMKMRSRACGYEFSTAVVSLAEKNVCESEQKKDSVSLRFCS
jgi:hypothetical protein